MNEHNHATREMAFEARGRLIGVEALLRTLLEQMARATGSPDDVLRILKENTVRALIPPGGIHDPVEAALILHAERQIEETIHHVRTRISGAPPTR